jgi:hypothetical protein
MVLADRTAQKLRCALSSRHPCAGGSDQERQLSVPWRQFRAFGDSGCRIGGVLPVRRRFRLTIIISGLFGESSLWDEVCGVTPQTTRRRRMFPILSCVVPA